VPIEGDSAALVAKAKALVSGESDARQGGDSIDVAMLAMRSNPSATHRLDGSASSQADPLPPDVMMDRLKVLARDTDVSAYSEPDRAAPDVITRLRELSRQTASSAGGAKSEDLVIPARNPAKPVSPEAVLRRMQELAAKQKASGQAQASSFGGLVAVVPAPDMERTPAVERAVKSVTGTSQ